MINNHQINSRSALTLRATTQACVLKTSLLFCVFFLSFVLPMLLSFLPNISWFFPFFLLSFYSFCNYLSLAFSCICFILTFYGFPHPSPIFILASFLLHLNYFISFSLFFFSYTVFYFHLFLFRNLFITCFRCLIYFSPCLSFLSFISISLSLPPPNSLFCFVCLYTTISLECWQPCVSPRKYSLWPA